MTKITQSQKLFFKIMRISFMQAILALLFGTMAYAHTTKAQELLEKRISLSAEDQKVENILQSISKLVEVRFMYSPQLIRSERKFTIKAENEKLETILENLLQPLLINYEVSGKYIILKKKADTNNDGALLEEIDVLQQTINGKVTDEKGEGVPGVNVLLKGTNTGTTTNLNGTYTLSIPDESFQNGTLVFSYIGYTTEETEISNRTTIDIGLLPDIQSLSEVVVVGYGTQKKTTVTGSVSTLKGNEVAETPVANVSSSIAGRMAGVSMRPVSGQPGSDSPQIVIRGIATTGSSNPLIVVDGIIRNNINQIDPNSIETITVLKDAAAVAPYGLGGANGVILITTKVGKTGAPTLSLNSYYGVQTPTYYPDMLGAQDYMRLKNEAYLNENPTGTQLPFAQDLVDNYLTLNQQDPDRYPISNTKKLVNMKAPMQSYNLQLSGGSERVRYYAGLGYLKQDGMFDPVNYQRYNFNMNLEADATKTTKISLSLIGAIEKTNSVDASTSPQQLFRNGFKYIPIASLYYSNGLWGEFAGNSPVGILKGGYTRNNANTLLTTISVEQQLPFIKGLSAKGTFSYDPYQRTIKAWHTPFYYYTQNTSTTPYTYTRQISTSEGGAPTYTWLSQDYLKNQVFTFQGYLTYHNTFGKHDINALFVAEARNNTSETFFARRNNFAINVDEFNFGSSVKADFDNSGTSSTGSQVGYVYRLGYTYAGKYLFEAAGRYDGHYYFAPGKRFAYFPAFSIGWLLSEESFIRNKFTFIDNLKIRGSWGKSGNLAGTAFQYLRGANLYGNAYAFGVGNLVPGSFIPREPNPNITWEVSTKKDIGFEATLWRGLLNIEADYFYEKREGMLLPPAITVPVEYGLALADQNAGVMANQGVEVSIGSFHEFKNNLQIGLSANFSYARNKMLEIFETAATFNNPNRRRTDKPLGTQFGFHALGLFQTSDDINGDGLINTTDGYNIAQFGALHPGDIRYDDISGPDGVPDGKIDQHDETQIGYNTFPYITYGITPTASWKGFDLSLFFQGAALSSLDIRQFQTIPFNNNNSNSSYEYYNDHWTPTNQGARYPRATQAPYANNTQLSDFWMMNTGYLRLKTGTLGYTIPEKLTQFLKIKSVRAYVSGQNILTISKLKFMDPEAGVNAQANPPTQDREIAYPNQKVYTVGLNVTF